MTRDPLVMTAQLSNIIACSGWVANQPEFSTGIFEVYTIEVLTNEILRGDSASD